MFFCVFRHLAKHRRPEQYRFSRFCVVILVLAVLMNMPVSLFAQEMAETGGVLSYVIAPGPLGRAVEQFARSSGINLSYDAALVDGAESNGLTGDFTVDAGLETILEGTGIVAEKHPGGWLLRREIPPSMPEPAGKIGTTTDPADDAPDTVQLPSLLVSENMATGIKELSVDQIHRNNASELADIFREEPSVVIGGGTRAAQRIYVRGIEATNLNVSVDGAVQGMNLFQHRGNIGGLNPDLLKKVEVQTGPGADQGAGALAGSIRFETADAQDLLVADKIMGAALRAGYATVDEGVTKGLSAYLQSAGGKLGFLAHGSRVDFGDYDSGDGGSVKGSGGEDKSLFFKFSLLDISGHSLRVSVDQYNNSGLYAGDHAYNDGNRNLSYQVSERITYALDHRYRSDKTELVNSKFNFFYNESSLDRGFETISEGIGGGFRNLATFSVGPTRSKVTAGVDYYSQDGIQKENNGIEDDTNVEATTLGIYLQDRMNIGPILFSFGIRYDDFDTVFGPLNITGSEMSPNAGVDLEVAKHWTLFAAYGEATRSTGIIPIQWLSNTTSDATLNQQEGKESFGKPFQPETSEQYEGGLRYNHESLIADGDQFNAEVTYFKTDIENLIAQIGGMRGQPVTGFYNDDPVTSEGFEVRAGWRFGGFKTSVSFTRAETTDKDGNAIRMSRRKGASTGDRLVWSSFWQIRSNLNFGYTLNYTGDLKEDDLDREGYVLHNIQGQWQPGFLPDLNITLAVGNLFDHGYSEQTSSGDDDTAVPEPGRDIRLGVTYRF